MARRLIVLCSLLVAVCAGCASGPSRNDFLESTDRIGDRYEKAMTSFEGGAKHAASIAQSQPEKAQEELKAVYRAAATDMQPLAKDLHALRPPRELVTLHNLECHFYDEQLRLLDLCATEVEKGKWEEFDRTNNELLAFLNQATRALADEFDRQQIDSSAIRKEIEEMGSQKP